MSSYYRSSRYHTIAADPRVNPNPKRPDKGKVPRETRRSMQASCRRTDAQVELLPTRTGFTFFPDRSFGSSSLIQPICGRQHSSFVLYRRRLLLIYDSCRSITIQQERKPSHDHGQVQYFQLGADVLSDMEPGAFWAAISFVRRNSCCLRRVAHISGYDFAVCLFSMYRIICRWNLLRFPLPLRGYPPKPL